MFGSYANSVSCFAAVAAWKRGEHQDTTSDFKCRAIAGFHIGSACAHTPLCTYPCSFAISTLLWLCAQCAFSLHSLACAHLERIRSCQRGHVKHAIGKLCIMNLVGNKKYNNLANALDKQCIYDITQVPALLVLILESTFHMQNIWWFSDCELAVALIKSIARVHTRSHKIIAAPMQITLSLSLLALETNRWCASA